MRNSLKMEETPRPQNQKLVSKIWQRTKKNVGLCTVNERHNENCSLTPLILKTHGVQVFSLLVQNTINGFEFWK